MINQITNWKYILIIVVLELVVAGAIFYSFLQVTNEIVSLDQRFEITMPEKIKDETAGWNTYRNEVYGFELKYPSDWKMESKFPGRLGPGQTEFREGVNPQFFLFAPVEKDLTKDQSDITIYIAPPGYFNCSNYTNLSIDGVNKFLNQNSVKDETEFCKSNIYFRFSVVILQEEIFNQILSTFRFLE